ncbi:transcriptional regulator RcsA [Citrobacter farmeri]|uniref:Helix-turn-helix transcriptional regulator n=2 Tax=Citrobacter farmeri TaxID=67824 RepID=A0ACA8D8P5_9ENTR|nr:transcriptional regulator RcsA [Citrobacter farmeri]MBU5644063.1 transcriptional regulator RcsA [Pluralibacter sp. S54_ASV_43]HAT2166497.1 transcriptional regulator RcsA [Citrobacter freundii]HAT3757438.1 transcriptional regulator RcsA [Citrobacter amalonaticus]AST80455.1 helix-turn-helix transcriptional regulator [Citrobacter farmeri]EHK0947004.1 transcriptional regulator RcsA [Citrobacter farmeri]
MSTIIMDLCSYTRLGLTGYLVSRGVKKREINDIETVDELDIACDTHQPSVVFINEDCFIHDPASSQHIKQIINQHPNTLFIVFMAIANVHFDEYLLVRKNLLISSKSIKPESLDDLLGDILKKETDVAGVINLPTLSLSRTESSMLRMWMEGQGTIQISDQMNIKAKTVSSHKGNIKRKIKTHNKQVIYHVVRLTDNVTNGIFVNMR